MSLPLTSRLSGYLDAVIAPELRERILQRLIAFAFDKPYHASYLATFLFFAFLPLLGLAVFLVSLAVILVATAVFWVGLALLVTAYLLAVAALLATGAYLYLVGVFLAGRWVRRTFLPASEIIPQGIKQQRSEVPIIKREALSDDDSGFASNGGTPAPAKKEPGTAEDEERDRMRRDIAKSLK